MSNTKIDCQDASRVLALRVQNSKIPKFQITLEILPPHLTVGYSLQHSFSLNDIKGTVLMDVAMEVDICSHLHTSTVEPQTESCLHLDYSTLPQDQLVYVCEQ